MVDQSGKEADIFKVKGEFKRETMLTKRDKEERIRQLLNEIEWLKDQMATKKLSQANIKEYQYQIRQKEICIAMCD